MLEKIKNLTSVEVLTQANAINVLWTIDIVEDGQVISSTNHRCSYGKGQREQFEADVEGADKYVDLIDWTADVLNP
jgi:hypothetical protein